MTEVEKTEEETPELKALKALRAELDAKRKKNIKTAENKHAAGEADRLKRDIAIEDKRAEAYAAGLTEEQLIECEWPVIGRCLARTPPGHVYREFAHKSGMLKADLTNDIHVHEKVAMECMLVPDGKTFLDLAREKCPHAPVQFGGAMIARMRDKLAEEGK